MNIRETTITGCFVIEPKIFHDQRGTFIKSYQRSLFESAGLEAFFPEEFYSISKKNVVRGMHFQTPPHDHAKLVSCLKGEILDVILDLRPRSSSFKKFTALPLSSENPVSVYIPRGCAHGFLSLSEESYVYYSTSSEHHVAHDTGVRWDSFGFNWPVSEPILSQRDLSFIPLSNLSNPFS